MAFGGTYTTGTIALTNGSTTATGTGTLWSPVVEQGDLLVANGMVAVIDTITDDTHFELKEAWAGIDFTGSYIITLSSWLRYEPALTQAKVREMLAEMDGLGWFYFVSGDAPDPDLGEEGQFALKVNQVGAAWQLWCKIDGVWALQNPPVGLDWQGAWNSATTYGENAGVTRLGRAYIALQANTNKPPESNPTFWSLMSQDGNRYDIVCWASDRPASGEKLLSVVASTTVTFSAGLTDSRAKAGTAPTTQAVFSWRKNGVEFATTTFAIGSTTGVFAMATDTTLNAGDILSLVTPNPRDATLADISLTLTGFR